MTHLLQRESAFHQGRQAPPLRKPAGHHWPKGPGGQTIALVVDARTHGRCPGPGEAHRDPFCFLMTAGFWSHGQMV